MSDPAAMAEYHSLVEQLYDPQTRRVARQKLVRAGAVGALLECLNSPNESVVWAAIESLSELRAAEAVRPLVELLARGVLPLDVGDALLRITGQNFNGDVRLWRQWLEATDGTPSRGLDVAACIQSCGQFLGVQPSGSDNSYQFKLSLPEGREQKVSVFFGREDEQKDPIVVIYSECGAADPKYYEAALRKNLTIPAGALAIRDVGGKPIFVIVDTMLTELVTPSTLAKKIENIAARADAIEKGLTKRDRY
jgi:hypothetical protein